MLAILQQVAENMEGNTKFWWGNTNNSLERNINKRNRNNTLPAVDTSPGQLTEVTLGGEAQHIFR